MSVERRADAWSDSASPWEPGASECAGVSAKLGERPLLNLKIESPNASLFSRDRKATRGHVAEAAPAQGHGVLPVAKAHTPLPVVVTVSRDLA